MMIPLTNPCADIVMPADPLLAWWHRANDLLCTMAAPTAADRQVVQSLIAMCGDAEAHRRMIWGRDTMGLGALADALGLHLTPPALYALQCVQCHEQEGLPVLGFLRLLPYAWLGATDKVLTVHDLEFLLERHAHLLEWSRAVVQPSFCTGGRLGLMRMLSGFQREQRQQRGDLTL